VLLEVLVGLVDGEGVCVYVVYVHSIYEICDGLSKTVDNSKLGAAKAKPQACSLMRDFVSSKHLHACMR
jgi:hypothetical protein